MKKLCLNFIISFLVTVLLSTTVYSQTLDANFFRAIQAERFNDQSGVQIDGRFITSVNNGDWVRFDNVNFADGSDSVTIRYSKADATAAGYEVRVDSLSGPVIAQDNLPQTNSVNTLRRRLTRVSSVEGQRTVFIRFTGNVSRVDFLLLGSAQRRTFQAERPDSQSAGITIQGRVAVSQSPGNWIGYDQVTLGDGFRQIRVRYGKGTPTNAGLEVLTGSLDSAPIASVTLPTTGSFTTFRTVLMNIPVGSLTGRDNVFFRFTGDGDVDLDLVQFSRQPIETTNTAGESSSNTGMFFFGTNGAFAAVQEDGADLRYITKSVSYNSRIVVRYARDATIPMNVEIRNNSRNGALYGTINLGNTGSFDTYQEASTLLTGNPQGIRNLVYVFRGFGGANIESISIQRLASGNNNSEPLGTLNLDNILVDQFGYTPEMGKVAVIRGGEIGFGSNDPDYEPSDVMEVYNALTGEVAFSGNITSFNNGNVEQSSGDITWQFDFSNLTDEGVYYVYDPDNDARSAEFEINNNVYEDVLKTTFRTFLYQRSGFEKTQELAGDWADGESHLGFRQESQARAFNDQDNSNTQRDLRGGWYDAGDYNKYTNWDANYILGLSHAYIANPAAWGDDFNMPDSGNGVPDILDEVKWGLEHLVRMQENNGSVLSVLGVDSSNGLAIGESPPSTEFRQSVYGPATTSATFRSAAAYALGATLFRATGNNEFEAMANDLENRAVSAYNWAVANPNETFRNTNRVAAGEQGVCSQDELPNNCYGIQSARRIAAIYLYDLTGNNSFRNFVNNDFENANIIASEFFVSVDESEEQTALLYYTTLNGVADNVRNNIRTRFNLALETAFNGWGSVTAVNPQNSGQNDPYRSFLNDYIFGSNRGKSRKGGIFAQLEEFNIGSRSDEVKLNTAAQYLHYIHGVNPFGLVYLSNMNEIGAERSVDQFYHAWFQDGSPFDSVSQSPIGPPPGYLVGGPNRGFTGSFGPVQNQPDMKTFAQINDFNSSTDRTFELTENSNSYQIEYLRLLSRFVD